MATEIKMPNLSQTTDEVKLIKWAVKTGDVIKQGDILCEVETDKVNMDVESFVGGEVLKLFYGPESKVRAGDIIAVIGSHGENTEKYDDKIQEPVVEKESVLKEGDAGEKIIEAKDPRHTKSTRLVKNLAAKKGVDLSKVKGTGPRGIIVKKDIEDYLKDDNGKKVIKLTSNQLAVSANITKSKKEIPHYYLNTKVRAERLLKLKEGSGVSIDSCIIMAAAKALLDFPRLNSTYKEGKIHLVKNVNIGFAVSKDSELFVPVIKEADNMELSSIDSCLKDMVKKVRSEELSLSDVSGGTATISNLGIYDIDSFYGVINYPQALLITVGKINKEVFVNKDNSLAVIDLFNISASFDHRIANGSIAAMFLTRLKKIIEEEIS